MSIGDQIINEIIRQGMVRAQDDAPGVLIWSANAAEQLEALVARGASAWASISNTLPAVGDVIACCAEHRDGGVMHWAGSVVEIRQGFAVMEARGEETRRFIITHDTLWFRLPPNTQASDAKRSG